MYYLHVFILAEDNLKTKDIFQKKRKRSRKYFI